MSTTQLIETVVNHVKETYPELNLNIEYIGGCDPGGANDDREWSVRCENKSVNAWIWHKWSKRSAVNYWHQKTKFTLGATHCKDALFVNHLLQGNFAHWLKEMEYYLQAFRDENSRHQRQGKRLLITSVGRLMTHED
jgi:hypothetical protein